MQLTQEQQVAVCHRGGHARIIAVAGAGKTATLTHYIGHRLDQGADPRRILVLMYNRAAQEAFSQRLQTVCKQKTTLPKVRTFHSLGLKLYQRLVQQGSLPAVNFKPLPTPVIELQIKDGLLRLAPKKLQPLIMDNLQEWLDMAMHFVHLAKCEVASPEVIFKRLKLPDQYGFFVSVFKAFEQWRQQKGAITFDDMLYDPVRCLTACNVSAARFSNVLDEILVDEYQDINPIQHNLLQILSGERAQVMVIGDPDQTIYEFRGSAPAFITQHFARDFPAPTTYCLSQTFRFGHAIALAANHLISHNREREPVITLSGPDTPASKIRWTQTDDHGRKVAQTVKRLHENGGPYRGMAVLCRLWSYARPVELHFMANGIPYRLDGGQSILQCPEIQPLLHLLRIMSGQLFEQPEVEKKQALFEVLTTPALKIAHSQLKPIAAAWAKTATDKKLPATLVAAISPKLNAYQKRVIKERADALRILQQKKPCGHKLALYLNTVDYQQRLSQNALNQTRGAEQAGTVTAFVDYIRSLGDQPAQAILDHLTRMSTQAAQNKSGVTITTIHRSKGLEWPVVFIPCAAEGHIPYTGDDAKSLAGSTIESERRLMYVAVTRTQKQLFITVPANEHEHIAKPSRFIDEMALELSCDIAHALNEQAQEAKTDHQPSAVVTRYLTGLGNPLKVKFAAARTLPSCADIGPSWRPGDRIRHAVLGLGLITKIDQERIHIHFDDGKLRAFVSELAHPHLSAVSA